MGTVFKPIITKLLPPGAEVTERDGVRIARWRSARGGLQTAPVRTTPRGVCVEIESSKYLARYKDGLGVTRTVATGCRDESNARSILAGLERRAERVLAGVLTPAEDAIADHRRSSIHGHVQSYLGSLRARGVSAKHLWTVEHHLNAVIEGCRFRALADLRREPVEKWLTNGTIATRSARTKNTYVNALKWFCNWCVDDARLTASPVARISRLDENADRRRQMRALTPDELVRLLDATRRRPVDEALRFNRGWRKNQLGAQLRPETRAKLERLGEERAHIYKAYILTGLRFNELASIKVCDVMLDAEPPHLLLEARNEKARRGATIPLRADLAEDLRRWIVGEARGPQAPLFHVPSGLLKVFNRDIAFAGIAKHDDRGWTVCVHGLRHTFATLMSTNAAARVTQAAMRHSSIDLSMRYYVDPRLIDVAGALKALPELPLERPVFALAGTDHLAV